MRQLCNYAYAIRAEGKENEDELKALDRELESEPGKEPTGHSTNVKGLMAAMRMQKR